MRVKKEFAKYVSLNILGMVGMSCYILADTYFISIAQGANGITALNLVLPIYNIIFAIGAMIGVGSAIRYNIAKSRKSDEADLYLFNALIFTTLFGFVFVVVGFCAPDKLLILLGADDTIVQTGEAYTRIFMLFAPIFMWNQIANAYCRNDGAPLTAMMSTLLSSIFNIVFDYVLMFPLGMGMKGAALATALSPVLGIMICMTHFLSKKSTVRIRMCIPSLKKLLHSCQVGVSAFVGEISAGVITLAFNYIILAISGNTAVAAYGVIANISLVTVSVFNGISNGSQPLISHNHGAENYANVRVLKKLAFITALILSVVLYAAIFLSADILIGIFNGENNIELYHYAHTGVRLYFIGIIFASINIIASGYLSATERAKSASVISVLRGFVLIVVFAVILPKVFGLNGVWLSYAAGEAVTTLVMFLLLYQSEKKGKFYVKRQSENECNQIADAEENRF